jgi:hypothetical protein
MMIFLCKKDFIGGRIYIELRITVQVPHDLPVKLITRVGAVQKGASTLKQIQKFLFFIG